ncbi:MAG: orotidine-5'-phosphate decarboxylase [Lactobacillales bacterium]|jgi:orotidine-5'-phosphate decarboxylase|nr:orotidine-5'-phosphate decarboxylase [Lactobacillales bacterium]
MARNARETRPVIALDFPSRQEAISFLEQFSPAERLFVKVGMELFYREGPEIIQQIKSLGHSIFLDLKLHDIPNTVKFAMCRLANLGVDMVNVHAAGGIEMMEAARLGLVEGVGKGQPSPKLLAVTQLTSTSEENMQKEQLISVSLEESVVNYAQNAQKAGLDGVVCSAFEVGKIKAATSQEFICLTPGIRLEGARLEDQKRVVTPKMAQKLKSDYIVVGRPVTRSVDPVKIYQKIKEEWMKMDND